MSARTVTFLTLVLVLTYCPLWLWTAVVYWTDPDRQSAIVLVSECVTKYLLFANGCFNPMALYVASETFSKLPKRYLCCSAQPVDKAEGDEIISYIIFERPSYPGRECSKPTALFNSPLHEAFTLQRN
jgi:hypothetical protein